MKRQQIVESYHKITDPERVFDIEFWQRLGEKAIFEAAQDMVQDYLLLREGYAHEPRLQRTLESFQKA